jgi:hypothetical protein
MTSYEYAKEVMLEAVKARRILEFDALWLL